MGWLLGAGVGFFLGGPLGAVMGGALEHVLSKNAYKKLNQTHPDSSGEQIFVGNLIAVMTKIAMADGSVSEAERKTIHDFFSKSLHYGGRELEFIDAIIEETKRANPSLHDICKSFDRFAGKEQRLLMLDLVYQVATTDHVITRAEKEAIHQVVSTMGIGPEEHDRVKSRHVSAKKNDHYTTLGLHATSSNDEVKKAYRQLAVQYHPDKVSHLGPELIAFANQKFKVINEAYSALQKERKF